MAIGPGNGFGAIFIALESDIFCGVASPNYQYILVFKLIKLSQLMAMGDFPFKQLNSLQLGKIRVRVMSWCHDNIIKKLNKVLSAIHLGITDLKSLLMLEVLHVSRCAIVFYELLQALSFKTSQKVPFVYLSR